MVVNVRKQAPDFKKMAVVGGLFEEITLDQYKGQWVVLVFIPRAFTFVCPTEVIAFDAALPKFTNRNAQILIASTDSQYTLSAWNRSPQSQGGIEGVQVPLVADNSHSLARDYGVLVESEGIALRGTFIINPDGEIVHENINDTPVGRCVEETLRVLDGFQFVQQHGETCTK